MLRHMWPCFTDVIVWFCLILDCVFFPHRYVTFLILYAVHLIANAVHFIENAVQLIANAVHLKTNVLINIAIYKVYCVYL